MSKLPLRYERRFYEEPPKPQVGEKRFRIEQVLSTSDRAPHWPGGCGEDQFYEGELDEPETAPEYTGQLEQAFSLKELNEFVQQHGLDESKVFITASFHDDYLCVEAVHIKEQTPEEIEEEYKEQLTEWNQDQEEKKEQERQRIKWQMEALQRQADKLNK